MERRNWINKRFTAILLVLCLLFCYAPSFVSGQQFESGMDASIETQDDGADWVISSNTGETAASDEEGTDTDDTEAPGSILDGIIEEPGIVPIGGMITPYLISVGGMIEGTDTVPDGGMEKSLRGMETSLEGPGMSTMSVGSKFGGYTVTHVLPTNDQIINALNNRVYEVTGGSGEIRVISSNIVLILNGTTRSDGNTRLRIEGSSQVTLYLVEGTVNTFTSTWTGMMSKDGMYAGIYVAPGATLTIEGPGSLIAKGGSGCAGIGGIYCSNSTVASTYRSGNITIHSGTVTATGGYGGAGIGGSVHGSTNTITINGGNVTAIAGATGGVGTGGAGIGGGGTVSSAKLNGISPAGTINITGGTVTATANESSAGIGGGYNSACGTINISGGKITATGAGQAAGIGSSSTYTGTINITGGVIDATSGNTTVPGVGGSGSHTIKVTSGSVHSKKSNGEILLNNGKNAGGSTVSLFALEVKDANGNALPNAEISVSVTGGGAYTYNALTSGSGTAYLWLPAGTYGSVLTNPLTEEFITYDIVVSAGSDTVQIGGVTTPPDPEADLVINPDNEKVYAPGNVTLTLEITPSAEKDVMHVAWFRESAGNPVNTPETFGSGYSIAGAGNKGVLSPNGFNGQVVLYPMAVSKNARYWVQITYIDTTTSDITYRVKYIDVDNIYTPAEVYVRALEDDGTAVEPYTKLTLPANAPYGIPFDLDGSTILTAPSHGFDSLTYTRNANMPAPIWDMVVPGTPFAATAAGAPSSQIILNGGVLSNLDAGSNAAQNLYRYTVTYAEKPAAPIEPTGLLVDIWDTPMSPDKWITIDGMKWFVVKKVTADGVRYAMLLCLTSTSANFAKAQNQYDNNYMNSQLRDGINYTYKNTLPTIQKIAVVPDLSLNSPTSQSVVSNYTTTMAGNIKDDILFALSYKDWYDLGQTYWSKYPAPGTNHIWTRTAYSTNQVKVVNTNGNSITEAFPNAISHREVFAVWVNASVLRQVTVYYVDTNGNAIGSPSFAEHPVLFDGTFSLTSIPKIANYQYLHWEKANGSQPDGTPQYGAIELTHVSNNASIYLVYAPKYKVTYNENNSNGHLDYIQATNVVQGSSGSVNAADLATTGFAGTTANPDFKGWNTAANGSGTAYAPGESVPVSGNVTLYAQWSSANLTLTISKKVTGLYGNVIREFNFHANFYVDLAGATPLGGVASFPYAIKSGSVTTASGSLPLINGKVCFDLKHGQRIEIQNVPKDCWIQIAEVFDANYDVSFVDSKTPTVTELGGDTGGITGTLRQLTSDRTFDFTNERVVVVTGADTGNSWVMILLPILALVLLFPVLAFPALRTALRRRKWG